MALRLSVCLTQVRIAKHTVTQTKPYSSLWTQRTKGICEIPMGSLPLGATIADGVGKNCRFSTGLQFLDS